MEQRPSRTQLICDTVDALARSDRCPELDCLIVTGDIPWAHLDIAGPGYHSGEPSGHLARGGTGVPVRTLLEMVDRIAAEG